MDINIIIPFVNEGIKVKNCLKSICNQKNNDQLNIIFVNNGQRESSTEKLIKDTFGESFKYEMIFEPNKGCSNARNAGLRLVDKGWVAFIDIDDYISDDFFEEFNELNDGVKHKIFKPYVNYIREGNEFLQTSREILINSFDVCFIFYWDSSKMKYFDCQIDFNETLDFFVSNEFKKEDIYFFFGIYNYILQPNKKYFDSKKQLIEKHPNNKLILNIND